MPRLTAEQRASRTRHETAAAALRTIEQATQAALALLLPLYEDGTTAALDPDEECAALDTAVNALHSLETAAHHLAFHRDRDADRAAWTYQDHAFAALVAANID